jgi:thiol-disulfide isomerase/thioredoxin
MKPEIIKALDRRVWVGLAVAVAVLAILGFKAAGYGPGPAWRFDRNLDESTAAWPKVRADALPGFDAKASYPDTPSEQVAWAIGNRRPAMILVHSTMCRPCRAMAALVQMVKRDYQPDVLFIEVLYDDPDNSSVLRWARVSALPASYFLDRSGEVKSILGQMKQEDLRVELARIAAAE